jgi:hypothetical protein
LFVATLAIGPFAGRELFGRGLPWLDAITLHTFLDMMLRGFPSFLLMGLGLSGVIYLGSRKWYRGASGYQGRAANWLANEVEYLGRESFMFLILHWLLISTTLALAHLQGLATFVFGLPEITLSPYGRVALVTAGVVLLIPPLARLRDRLAQWEFFRPAMFAVMILSIALSYPIGWVLRSMEARLFVTYGASIAFAFVYPTLRVDLRRRFTAPLGVVDNPPVAPPS